MVLKAKRGIRGRKERRGRGQSSKKEKGKEKERCVNGRRERKQREEKGENRRKRRREKVMEEAVAPGILQPTGRKVVRYKHTKNIETGESRLA